MISDPKRPRARGHQIHQTDGVSISVMSGTTDLFIREVVKLIEPILDEMVFELVDIECLSEHGRWVLRIYVDKEGGITLDDCARVSKEIGDLIDVRDIFNHKYVLEVSSPGLNRRLKKEKDFLTAVGKKVKIRMGRPVEGRRNFAGYLRDFRDQLLYIETKDSVVPLSLQDVEKANIVFEFKD